MKTGERGYLSRRGGGGSETFAHADLARDSDDWGDSASDPRAISGVAAVVGRGR
jgi:hypothetical protein